jgi:hypothetical protein
MLASTMGFAAAKPILQPACTVPIAMATAACVGSITGTPSASSSGAAVARHAGAAHDHHVGAVLCDVSRMALLSHIPYHR